MKKNDTERVLKYRLATRIFHWTIVVTFFALVVTGAFLFFPPCSSLAQNSLSRLIHRISAVIAALGVIIYVVTNWKVSWESVKEAFTWGVDDLGWIAAAPRYYFLCDEAAMPPQEHINTGQKLWYLITLVAAFVFVITGVLMWFFKDMLPSGIFQWSIFFHDVYFVVVLAMFFVHLYLGVLHPLMCKEGGSFSAMWRGTITARYAKSHHGKWYEKVAKKS